MAPEGVAWAGEGLCVGGGISTNGKVGDQEDVQGSGGEELMQGKEVPVILFLCWFFSLRVVAHLPGRMGIRTQILV